MRWLPTYGVVAPTLAAGVVLFSAIVWAAAHRGDVRQTAGVADNPDDALMFEIMRRALRPDSNCVDVGAFRGTHLATMERYAPRGTHYAFEPVPDKYRELREVFQSPRIRVYELALSDRAETKRFYHVRNDPGFSGFERRPYYPETDPDIDVIDVHTDTLDHVLPSDGPIDLIKIDVEGAELLVLEGAHRTIAANRPVILFEHGIAGSGPSAKTERIYDLLVGLGLRVGLMSDWLDGEPPLSRQDFLQAVYRHTDSNFVAAPWEPRRD